MLNPKCISADQGGLSFTFVSQKLRVGIWQLEEEMGREGEDRQELGKEAT